MGATMTTEPKCPNCGAKASKELTSGFRFYDCASDDSMQSDRCHIAQLEEENVSLRAELGATTAAVEAWREKYLQAMESHGFKREEVT